MGLLGALLSFLLVAWPPGHPAQAQASGRQLQLTDFQMQALVDRTGSVEVTETLTARFQGSWNGLVREIPLVARRPQGPEPLGWRLLSVSDGEGHPYRYETSIQGAQRQLKIFIPEARDATRSAVIRYRVNNGIRFYPSHDEFYWNVTGNGWRIPIERVTARVRLPEGASNLRASVYTGVAGSTASEARLQIGPDGITASSTRGLEPGEGLTLAMGFAKGLVAEPTPLQWALRWLQARLVLLLPLLVGLPLGLLWYRVGRDPRLGPVPVTYEPPESLAPALLASLVAEGVSPEALGATLVDLAVKGHLRIEAQTQAVLLLFSSKLYRFTLLSDRERQRQLQPHERYLLSTLFPSEEPGASTDTDALRNTYYVHVPGFEKLVREALLAQKVYRAWPSAVRAATFFGSIAAVLVLALLMRLVLPPEIVALQGQADPWWIGVALLLSLVLILLFTWIMPSRTTRGTVLLRQTLGFHEFLGRVEAPRFQRLPLTPELFERYLPYAIAAGQALAWSAAFKGILVAPPSWYGDSSGAGGPGFSGDSFNATDFGHSLSDCCRSASSSMHTSPSSSSSGGSSGGGSSGGGDGGGGGGGF
ncbi:DUF2207 domain-containing protein [Vulcanococcus limneticus]|uniref:DUF2207 domain-containing protein n=1 Tax=Vulcanococcus limneticus TaxID=2170428 RepID=UPI00398BCB24